LKRTNRHLILLLAILAVEACGIGAAGALTSSPMAMLPFTTLLPFTVLGYVAALRLTGRSSMRGLSPQDFTRRRVGTGEEAAPTPEALSRSIVERAEEIRRAMQDSPSEVRVEMCALGYRACANDMLTLTHIVNEELHSAGPLKRRRLRRHRRRAAESISAAREALPQWALRTTRQEL